MRAKRWNERIKLLMVTLNTLGIGLLGLAVVAPLVAVMSNQQSAGRGSVNEKLALLRELSLWDNVVWGAALIALGLHVLAHGLVSFLEEED